MFWRVATGTGDKMKSTRKSQGSSDAKTHQQPFYLWLDNREVNNRIRKITSQSIMCAYTCLFGQRIALSNDAAFRLLLSKVELVCHTNLLCVAGASCIWTPTVPTQDLIEMNEGTVFLLQCLCWSEYGTSVQVYLCSFRISSPTCHKPT